MGSLCTFFLMYFPVYEPKTAPSVPTKSVYKDNILEWGGRREEGSGWGTHVYLWRIHFDIWQN